MSISRYVLPQKHRPPAKNAAAAINAWIQKLQMSDVKKQQLVQAVDGLTCRSLSEEEKKNRDPELVECIRAAVAMTS